ncbi:MAG: YdcF family protein [Kiloniellales bacterium]
MYLFSKIVWALVQPGNLLLLLLIVGCLALFLPRERWRRFGCLLVSIATLALVAIAASPLGAWLLLPLEARFPAPLALPVEIDGIVALGGSYDLETSAGRNQAAIKGEAERITALVTLARRYPEARLVYSGGSYRLWNRSPTEADLTAGVVTGLGLEPDRIHFERQSRNTWENAVGAFALAQPKPGETWLLITSAYHMPRAMGCFRTAGWHPIAYPVDYRTSGKALELAFNLAVKLELTTLAVREWLGLLAYRLLGYSGTLLPGPSS